MEIITSLRRLFHSAHLVHADCSAYNILVHDLHPVFIDFGQAVDVSHPRYSTVLYRITDSMCGICNISSVAIIIALIA